MEEYLPLFNDEGYTNPEDIEHMVGMTREDLKNMGITKRGTYANYALTYVRTYVYTHHTCNYTYRLLQPPTVESFLDRPETVLPIFSCHPH